jgi:hypothetical protein
MTMTPGLRKLALAVHLTCSVGWIGAVVAYLALVVYAVTARDAQTVWVWTATEVTGWWAIVPLAVAALLTGLIMALGTPWGLFRHYWVLISLALTILCTVVLVEHMSSVSATAAMLRATDTVPGANGAGHGGMGVDLVHPGVGLIVLLVIAVLNVYKPRGLTRYGWRKQQERRRLHRRGVSMIDDESLIRPVRSLTRPEVRQ